MTLFPLAIRLLITGTTPGPSATDSTRVISRSGTCSCRYLADSVFARTHDDPDACENSTKATLSLSPAMAWLARNDPPIRDIIPTSTRFDFTAKSPFDERRRSRVAAALIL